MAWLILSARCCQEPFLSLVLHFVSCLKQTSIRDVITLNLALLLHPTRLTWGSTPSFHQHYLISTVSVARDSDCLFNTSLKLMPVFEAALLPLPKH